jgi:hypothetical protein
MMLVLDVCDHRPARKAAAFLLRRADPAGVNELLYDAFEKGLESDQGALDVFRNNLGESSRIGLAPHDVEILKILVDTDDDMFEQYFPERVVRGFHLERRRRSIV